MKKTINEDLNWIIFLTFICSIFIYVIYVVQTATHKPGCNNSYEKCIKSHIEIKNVYYGKYQHQIHESVCDEYKTVNYNRDCITYHWIWGDSKY